MTIRRYRNIIFLAIIFGLFWGNGVSFAQSPSLTNGLSYLQSTQSPSGYWGDAAEVPYNSFVDTYAVAVVIFGSGELLAILFSATAISLLASLIFELLLYLFETTFYKQRRYMFAYSEIYIRDT